MVTRFSASEARLKAESAQKARQNQIANEKIQRRLVAKEKALINKKYLLQRRQIISAAIEAKTEIEVDSVILFGELVSVGIQVIEVGVVKSQSSVIKNIIDVTKCDAIKKELLSLFDKFIDDSKPDLKIYYNGFKHFHKLNYDALYDALNSNWEWSEFIGDDIFFEMVPDDVKSKFETHFSSINSKIKEFKRCNTNFIVEYDDDDVQADEDNLISGEFYFSDQDNFIDILEPSIEGNFFKIKWISEVGSSFMNAPLLSDSGLAWLSTYRGQNLIESIFNALSDAAEQAKSSIKLDFSLTKDGWYFLSDGRKVYCCMPDEIVDIIEQENFTIDETLSTDNSYLIKVSW